MKKWSKSKILITTLMILAVVLVPLIVLGYMDLQYIATISHEANQEIFSDYELAAVLYSLVVMFFSILGMYIYRKKLRNK